MDVQSLIVPVALVLFGMLGRRNGFGLQQQPSPQPQPQRPQPQPQPRPMPRPSVPRPTARPASPATSSAPATQTDAAAQAAVDAAVKTAIREEMSKNLLPPPPPIVESTRPVTPQGNEKALPIAIRSPRQAALDLADFLRRTRRFGSASDKPAEVIAAQRDMGVQPKSEDDWGYVGPLTRAAARKYGVTLPK